MELVEECRDKRGKLDTEKVYLKFIDAFTLSIYTAKALYGYKIHEASDPEKAAKDKAGELFDKLDIGYNIDDVHYVHYCYYNCSEPIDYYEPN